MQLRKITRNKSGVKSFKLGSKLWHWILLFCVLGVIGFGYILLLKYWSIK